MTSQPSDLVLVDDDKVTAFRASHSTRVDQIASARPVSVDDGQVPRAGSLQILPASEPKSPARRTTGITS
jgi:hypothetical protein